MTEPDKPLSKPSDVQLGVLLTRMAELVGKHVSLTESGLVWLIACWVAQTYCFKDFRFCGYLWLRSAIPRCGKSTLLELISFLSAGNPPITTNPTPAGLFRSGERVILLDEADKLRGSDPHGTASEVISILNVGYRKGGVVERQVKTTDGDFKPGKFPVFGPKAFAGIEELAGTLADRCFLISMQPAAERLPRLNERSVTGHTQEICNGLTTWVERNHIRIQEKYEGTLEGVPDLAAFNHRYQDISEPLTVLADLADQERSGGPAISPLIFEGLRAAVRRSEPSKTERELMALLEVVTTQLGDKRDLYIKSSDLLTACGTHEELKLIRSEKALAERIRHLGLSPGKSKDGKSRGYHIAHGWLEDQRKRYRARGEASA